MITNTILEIIEGVKNNDERSIEIFVNCFKAITRLTTLKYNLEEEDREDIIQQCVSELVEAAKRYDKEKASFKAYSGVIISRIVNRAVDKIYLDNRFVSYFTDANDVPDTLSEVKIQAIEMITALERSFNPKEMEVIEMFVMYDFGANKVAEKCGLSQRVVYSIVAKFYLFMRDLN